MSNKNQHNNSRDTSISTQDLYGQPKFTLSHIGKGGDDFDYRDKQTQVINELYNTQPSNDTLKITKQRNGDLYNDLNALHSGSIVNKNIDNNTRSTFGNGGASYNGGGSQYGLGNGKHINHLTDQKYHNNERYDPYIGYLYQQGLLGPKPNLRYNIFTINVDSRNRIKKPSVEITGSSNLNNPLTFTRNSKIIQIRHPNSELDNNDAITLTGVAPIVVTVSSSGIVKEDVETDLGTGVGECTTIEVSGTIFEFKPGSKYMKIKHTHYLPVVCSYDVIAGPIVVFKNDPFYDTYDISDLSVEISGFKGNRSDVADIPYYDNIPVSRINNKHTLILKDPDTGRIKRNVFFIKLPRAYQPLFNTIFEPPPVRYNFKIIFHYYGGIPINLLNAEYPLDFDHARGFHVVVNRTDDGYLIESLKTSCGIADSNGDLLVNNQIGGPNIICSKIDKVIKGFPDANDYNIQLNRVFTDVVSARLISTEFPNTEKVIRDLPENRRNNRIYWQNLDDGDYIYMAEIAAGNYKADELEIALEQAFYNTPRINYTIDNPTEINANFKRVVAPYTNHNYVRVTINESTDVVRFRAYKENFFFHPIISVEPEIPTDPSSDVSTEQKYKIVISHESHNLEVGDKILIASAIAHLGIPANIINNEHVISEIIDDNTYKIELNKFNLEVTRIASQGGNAVAIYIPMLFRLRFDKTDTLGTILGFRDVGESTSITTYNNTITNNEKYEFELNVDEFGQTKTFKNNAILLSGFNYVHMFIKQLQVSTGLGEVKDFFSKILLPDTPGSLLFNTFAQSNKIFYDPVGRLSELDIQFYGPFGDLFDFNGIDHSFTLEITTADETPPHTGISAKTGKIN